ncbi:MAG TPA: TSUP family transporter [Steroidobacteraceae bacterium]|nr:TSUP family transporter [Steroidobacteraceae bacterium]
MLTARVVLYGVLVLVNAAALIAWVARTRRRQPRERASWFDTAIGAATNFLDTFGIGSYAQITALFKLRGRPADELIPGTLNVGSTLPSFIGSLLFFGVINVEPVLLASMVVSSGAGAWLGAGVVSRLPRRSIQLFMGCALIIAAGFFLMTALGVLPPTGTAMELSGWRFAVAVLANFLLGALMCIGIGNYAPSMVLLGLLGMHPIAAYPIMIGSDGVLIAVASLGFLRSGRFAHGVAIGLTVGGVIGTLVAFPLIRTIGEHLALMRWLAIVVIVYAAFAMLRSASARGAAAPLGTAGASSAR